MPAGMHGFECRFVKYEMYQGSRKKVIPED